MTREYHSEYRADLDESVVVGNYGDGFTITSRGSGHFVSYEGSVRYTSVSKVRCEEWVEQEKRRLRLSSAGIVQPTPEAYGDW